MAEEQKTYDLDELLGQKIVLKVKHKGVEHGLTDLNTLGVHKILQFQGMRQKVARLQLLDEISEEQAAEIENLFTKMIAMICPTLPLSDVTYAEKTAILGFYFSETAPKKKMIPSRASQTGETSSQS